MTRHRSIIGGCSRLAEPFGSRLLAKTDASLYGNQLLVICGYVGPYSVSLTVLPSLRTRVRSQLAAMLASWVAMSTVRPRSARSRSSTATISAPVWVSRLPVGSSANTMPGSIDERAGDRHALLLAARELRR